MQITDPRHRRVLVRTVLFFLASYMLSLVIWIQIKDGYGYAMTVTASKFAAALKDARLDGTRRENDSIRATFTSLKADTDMLVDITVKTSSYTFNAPLTFAIIASLSPFLARKKKACAEALGLLLLIHFLYIFSLEAKGLTEVFIDRQIEPKSVFRLGFYQFLWGFTDNMVIRFEPFLIGFYMFMSFRKPPVG
jgi:hypothetical protein